MDVQNAIVGMLADPPKILDPLGQVIKTAHANDIPIIYAVVGFRKGYPEISLNNQSFSRLKNSAANFDSEEASKVYSSVAPGTDDIVITKKRVSAFTGSDLEVVLRSQGITHLMLSGISTSGVVLSTLREAADKDYKITVLSDCCADRDEEVHRVLMTKVFPHQAEVIPSEEFESYLQEQ